ncbi:MAG: hypothetical protein ABI267_03270 [Ginsengibacter sp.]
MTNNSDEVYKTHMTTLSEVLEKLRLKKIDNEFKMEPQGFIAGNNKHYQPEELKIIRTYRFEGESNPADNSAIYIIEAPGGLIGYSIDAYGVYSDHEEGYDDFLRKIKVEEKEESNVF